MDGAFCNNINAFGVLGGGEGRGVQCWQVFNNGQVLDRTQQQDRFGNLEGSGNEGFASMSN